jgi:hypothetical protein
MQTFFDSIHPASGKILSNQCNYENEIHPEKEKNVSFEN